MRDKLNHLMDDKATELMDKVRANGGDLEAAAKSMGLEVKIPTPSIATAPSRGWDPPACFRTPLTSRSARFSAPAAIADGKIVGKVVEKIPADPAGLAAARWGFATS